MRNTAIFCGAVILSCVTFLSVTEAKSIADVGRTTGRNGLDNVLSDVSQCTKYKCSCCGEGPNSTVCSFVTVIKNRKENGEFVNALEIDITIDGVLVRGGIFQGSDDLEGIFEFEASGVYVKLVTKGVKKLQLCGSLQLILSKDRVYKFEDICFTVPPTNAEIGSEETYADLANQVRVHLEKLKGDNRHSSQENEEARLGSIFPDNPFIPFIPWST